MFPIGKGQGISGKATKKKDYAKALTLEEYNTKVRPFVEGAVPEFNSTEELYDFTVVNSDGEVITINDGNDRLLNEEYIISV